jgi:thiol-disulfide isomerase/thioredoxin
MNMASDLHVLPVLAAAAAAALFIAAACLKVVDARMVGDWIERHAVRIGAKRGLWGMVGYDLFAASVALACAFVGFGATSALCIVLLTLLMNRAIFAKTDVACPCFGSWSLSGSIRGDRPLFVLLVLSAGATAVPHALGKLSSVSAVAIAAFFSISAVCSVLIPRAFPKPRREASRVLPAVERELSGQHLAHIDQAIAEATGEAPAGPVVLLFGAPNCSSCLRVMKSLAESPESASDAFVAFIDIGMRPRNPVKVGRCSLIYIERNFLSILGVRARPSLLVILGTRCRLLTGAEEIESEIAHMRTWNSNSTTLGAFNG